ncbi:hypothetical protein D8674_025839 [Pyrus ussuriensis x Pyrus communis]|uniref:Uncharacterized protein n=1 Tax=Pyrus ussuriensis x Pyrus communis TaxID=2448454 RepID=A0A5N5I531_9ROSA|nr:hypothetical protein D8674_025839 [Pyrus ussuriensis x Pyrus communis]
MHLEQFLTTVHHVFSFFRTSFLAIPPIFAHAFMCPFLLLCCQTKNKMGRVGLAASSLSLFDSVFILSTASILLSRFHSLLIFFSHGFVAFFPSLQLSFNWLQALSNPRIVLLFWAPSFFSLLLAFSNLDSSSFPRKTNLKSTTQNSVIVGRR